MAKGMKVVVGCPWNAQKGRAFCCEELVDELVALDAVRALMRGVVEFDGAEDAAGAGLREDEVDVLAADFVESALVSRIASDVEEIGKADF